MNFMKYFAILIVISFAKPIKSWNFPHQYPINDNKLVKSVCKVLSEIVDQKIQTQDILIGNFGGLIKNIDSNDVASCVSDRHPVVVADLTMKMTTKNLRKASFVILTLNKIDAVK